MGFVSCLLWIRCTILNCFHVKLKCHAVAFLPRQIQSSTHQCPTGFYHFAVHFIHFLRIQSFDRDMLGRAVWLCMQLHSLNQYFTLILCHKLPCCIQLILKWIGQPIVFSLMSQRIVFLKGFNLLFYFFFFFV